MSKLLAGLVLVVAVSSAVVLTIIVDARHRGMQGIAQRSTAAADPAAEMGGFLSQMARTINATLPVMVGPRTRLDATIGGDRVFTYVYTMADMHSSGVSAGAVNAAFGPAIRHNYCSTPGMKPLVDAGISAEYIYMGRDGIEITRFLVSPLDCQRDTAAPIIRDA